MFYETKNHHGLKHNPFKSLIVPRPIGWVSTMDREGVVNLAPYSFFNGVCSDPPTVMFASEGSHVDGAFKDSATNVGETGEFVCNIATWELRDAMNATSAHVPRSVNEFELAKLTPAPARLVTPPRVAESPVHLECTHLQTVELPSNDPARPEVRVPATLDVTAAPDIDLSSSSLDFGTVFVGAAAERTLEIDNLGSEPLELRDLSVAGADFSTPATLPLVLAPGSSHSLPAGRIASADVAPRRSGTTRRRSSQPPWRSA